MSYSVGDIIKSYDFPGKERKHCFIEGEILSIDHDGGWLEVDVKFDSLEAKDHSRVGTTVTVPIKSELDSLWEYERIEILKS